LCEKKGGIITLDDIQWAYFVMTPGWRSQAYKLVLRLKANNIVFPLKNWLYYISAWEAVNTVDIIDKYYWKIVRRIISSENTLSEYFISWIAPVLLGLKMLDAPEELVLYTKNTKSIIKLSSKHTIKFTTVSAWKWLAYTNAFTKLKSYTSRKEIEWESFILPNIELALMEFLSHGPLSAENSVYVKKFLQKFGWQVDRNILGSLVNIRYISAINRLRELAKNENFSELYDMSLEIIQKEGRWCFLTMHKK